MKARYKVKLTPIQRGQLLSLIHNGTDKAKKLTHARVLLQADVSKEGSGLQSKAIAEQLHIHPKTVRRIRARFVLQGLEAALNRKPHKHYKPRKLDGEQESYLIALCCSKAPEGSSDWTLQLLCEHLVKLQVVQDISHSTLCRTLKKTNLSLG